MKQGTNFVVQSGWRLLLADMGVDSARVLRHANLPADLFSRQEATITAAQFFELWQAIEQVGGDDMALPLKLGQAISVEAFDPAIFACLCSPNLNVAFQRLSVFKKLIGPMGLVAEVGANQTSVTLECYSDAGPIPHSMAAAEIVYATQLVRIATRHRVVPREITLPELPDHIQSYEDFFGVMPKAGKTIRLTFSKEDGVRQFLTANDSMWKFFEVGLRERLTTLDSTATISDRVKAVLLEGLPSGQYTVNDVAKHLAVSKRTLQRQLSEESTSFKDILIATRQQLAVHYLRKPSIAQGEIAFLLGFQDVNSFIRAFKDWQGVTPGAYRLSSHLHRVS
ncbi:AraC family transcriptional regulator ligand-binding domain-containing protein [Pseudomonas sp. TH32]|jgi:AraC-like DNA-binding protein|uniref:AraC family transcriptional regulator n=1 Tax=unclassified Pseudomonas TaxID=196821 RepID=UPI000289E8D0|nr:MULTISPECIES: AraC family transcriptional regulator [unclassified Pseudomonas]MBK5438312.1 AraC family transcriptional regulator ligand-binding domain-containing protein [Pseudomonas sp. TH32]MDF3200424.1 AraC family transcriptional regulator ligand-binding domain-containing protein [Pseudomonas sp. 1912-s]